MNIKNLLFKLGLRRIKTGDIVTTKRDGFKRTYLVIGKPMIVGRTNGKTISFVRTVAVASSNKADLDLSELDFITFKISSEYSWVENFYILDIKDITEVR